VQVLQPVVLAGGCIGCFCEVWVVTCGVCQLAPVPLVNPASCSANQGNTTLPLSRPCRTTTAAAPAYRWVLQSKHENRRAPHTHIHPVQLLVLRVCLWRRVSTGVPSAMSLIRIGSVPLICLQVERWGICGGATSTGLNASDPDACW
jgi:hypothetical protein